MAKTNTKIGDVFSVKINENSKKYFQLVAFDLRQLNSDVIRAFEKSYRLNENPDLAEIVNDEIDFYAHCVTKFGIKMGLWEVIGNTTKIGNTDNILFRGTSDYGTRPGLDPIKVSHNWHVWKINDKHFTDVGKLEGENLRAEIGIVVTPIDIVDRLRTGKYNFVYPGFE